jgi:hypothetical protein
MQLTDLITSDSFVNDAAAYAGDLISLEQLASLHSMTEDQAIALMSDPSTAQSIDTLTTQHSRDGTLAKSTAIAVVQAALERMRAALEREDLSISTTVRIAETAHKISGLGQVRPEQTALAREGFSVNIILADNGPKNVPSEVIDVASKEVP